MKALKRTLLWTLLLITLSCSTGSSSPNQKEKADEAKPEMGTPFSIKDIQPGSRVDCSSLNGGPIGSDSRIEVNDEGHLERKNERIKLFGVNITFIPEKNNAPELARRLAALGVNVIRFHHIDAPWGESLLKGSYNSSTRKLNPEMLDRLDFFIYQLKQQGIYVNMNLLTGRNINSHDGLPPAIDEYPEMKTRHALGFWDQRVMDLQKEYAEQLLAHPNPYTELSYTEDPVISIVEINNENGLLMAYLNGWLDPLSREFMAPLNQEWEQYIVQKYGSAENFYSSLALTEEAGEILISAGELETWNLEHHGSSMAEMERTEDSWKIRISKASSENWHVQFNKSGLRVEPQHIYTLSFRAKATKESSISVSLGMAHAPWQGLGFNQQLDLSRQWQDFSFSFSGIPQLDNNARINFSDMGNRTGEYEFADIQFQQGGSLLQTDRNLSIPKSTEYKRMPQGYRRELTAFLYETEQDYWNEMSRFLKEDLKIQSLLMGTILGCSTPGLMADFDIIDSHAYWNHPGFPGNPWDMDNYYVENRSLVHDRTGGTLTGLALKRIYGKPFSVSEYDHPYPNQYTAEMWPLLASFASFQDWDCIYGFNLNKDELTSGGELKISGFFDQSGNPSKAAALPVAARIFRQSLVQPARQAVYARLDRQLDRENLMHSNPWNLGNPEWLGLKKESALVYRTGIVWDGETPGSEDLPAHSLSPEEALKQAESTQKLIDQSLTIINDTGEIHWNPRLGYYEVTASRAYIFAGFNPHQEERSASSLIGFIPENTFDVLAAVSLKIEEPRESPEQWLLFSCGQSSNRGEDLREYGSGSTQILEGMKLTTRSDLGTGPAMALGARGIIQLPQSVENSKLYLLNSRGEIYEERTETGEAALFPEDHCLWYILQWNP